MIFLIKDKKAVVLSGGGARGSYQIGVWKALREVGYDYKIVTGCSVGSINGAMMVLDEFDKSMELWEIIETEKIMNYDISGDVNTPHKLFAVLTNMVGKAVKDKGISTSPLKKVLDQFIHGDDIINSGIDYGITVTKLNGFKGKEIFIKDIDCHKINDYIMGSSAFYPVMQSYNIDGEEYIDGGYYNNMPISMALDMGATEILAVDLKSIGLVKKQKIPSDVKSTTITASWDLGALLMFSPHRAIRNIQLGYLDGLKSFGILEGKKYTFAKGELSQKTSTIEQKMKILLEKMKINLFYHSINSSDILIKTSILRTINKEIWKQPLAKDMVLFGAEVMGEAFSVSPLEVYEFEKFDEVVYNKLNAKEINDEKEDILLSEREIIGQMTGDIINKSRRSLLVRLLEIMGKSSYSDGDVNVLNVAASMSTTEFLGALYGTASGINLIENL